MQNTSTSSDLLAQSAKPSAKEVIVASPALNVTSLELRQKEGEVPEGLLPKEQIVTWHGTRLQPEPSPGTRELGCGIDPGLSPGKSPIQYFRADVINAEPHRLALQPQLKAKYTGVTQASYLRAQDWQKPSNEESPGLYQPFGDSA
jgi:hypothetical protein